MQHGHNEALRHTSVFRVLNGGHQDALELAQRSLLVTRHDATGEDFDGIVGHGFLSTACRRADSMSVGIKR